MEIGLPTRLQSKYGYDQGIPAKEARQACTLIGDLNLKEELCETDSEHRLLFKLDLAFRGTIFKEYLTERRLVALALTNVCCDVGKGKVYWFLLPANPKLHEMKDGTNKTKAIRTYYTLPKLVYVPLVWSDRDKREWLEMKLSDRLTLLNARSGSLTSQECVMPLDLMFDNIEKKTIHLNGHAKDNQGCKATLVIVPKAYLGWTHQLQQNHKGLRMGGTKVNDGKGLWLLADEDNMERYRMHGLRPIVERLWGMYFEGEPKSLERFHATLRGLVYFNERWCEHPLTG